MTTDQLMGLLRDADWVAGAICDSLEELDSLLPRDVFRRDDLIWEATFLAGQAFRRYRQNKGLGTVHFELIHIQNG